MFRARWRLDVLYAKHGSTRNQPCFDYKTQPPNSRTVLSTGARYVTLLRASGDRGKRFNWQRSAGDIDGEWPSGVAIQPEPEAIVRGHRSTDAGHWRGPRSSSWKYRSWSEQRQRIALLPESSWSSRARQCFAIRELEHKRFAPRFVLRV